MTVLPAHVVETVETTRTFRCGHCHSRLILGSYEREGYPEEILAAWLSRHRHGVTTQTPATATEPSR